MSRVRRVILLGLGILPLLVTAASGGPEEAYVWADVSISASGVVEQVKVVQPLLSRDMAGPIEKAIASATFAPGTEGGLPVRRTTSVLLVVRMIAESDGESSLQADTLDEGPRILQRFYDRCLEGMPVISPVLTFTVTADGRAEAISGSDPQSAGEQCAIKVTRGSRFKPDTVNGKPTSTRASRRLRLK